MVKIGTKIVYRNQVCTVADIALKYRNNEDFYVLTPFRDETLLIRVPISIADTVIRPLITQLELDELIKKIPDIETVPINNWNRGTEYKVDFVPKVKMEVVVGDELVDKALTAILGAAKTGQVGDGKIFVTNLAEVVRVRTGETGAAAI